MASGGARPGAGRKPKAEQYARPIAAAEKRIADKLPQLLDRMFELADGVTVSKPDAEGGTNVYKSPPCVKALMYLMNRIMGQPTAHQEHSGPGGKPIEFKPSDAERKTAEQELNQWRESQNEQISNLLSAPPTAPTSSTTS